MVHFPAPQSSTIGLVKYLVSEHMAIESPERSGIHTRPMLAAIGVTLLSIPFVLPFWIIGDAWWDGASDFAHFIAFGVIGALLVAASNGTSWNMWHRVILAAFVSLILAVVTELVQFRFYPNRSGNLADVLRNFGGALCALTLILAFAQSTSWRVTISWLFMAIALLITAAWPTIKYLQVVEQQNEQLPVLNDFNQEWEWDNLLITNGTRREKLAGDSLASNYELTIDYPYELPGGLRLEQIWSDWSKFKTLEIDLFVETTDVSVPIKIYVVYVSNMWQLDANWATVNTTLHSGENRIRIPLEDITDEGKSIDLATSRIKFLEISKHRVDRQLTLTLNRVSLGD